MSLIQDYPEELYYVAVKLKLAGDSRSFLATFCKACLRADVENYELLRPVLHFFMGKYPAPTELLAKERLDTEG